jgi:streptogramin lyase
VTEQDSQQPTKMSVDEVRIAWLEEHHASEITRLNRMLMDSNVQRLIMSNEIQNLRQEVASMAQQNAKPGPEVGPETPEE